jgi:hypothetical protein
MKWTQQRCQVVQNTLEKATLMPSWTSEITSFTPPQATIATLLATARLNGVDPQAWLALTLECIAAGWPNRDLDKLLPWNVRQA